MTFTKRDDFVSEGDTVIIRRGTTIEPLIIKADAQYQLTAGLFRHNDIIGKPFGCMMYSHNKKMTMTIMAPTPELWTLALPHRTQILYSSDISLICLQLEITPGSFVVESGTGSGSLTHALARAVGESGHVHTCEFHKERSEAAAAEFAEHGLDNVITCNHRNVCTEGFGISDKADAVFLDLPCPWDAIPHAITAFSVNGGRLCSFSPCIEQVQKCCLALQEQGFEEIQTFEGIERTYQLSRKRIWEPFVGRDRHKKFRSDQRSEDKASSGWVNAYVKGGPRKDAVGHTGYLTFATFPSIPEVEKETVVGDVAMVE